MWSKLLPVLTALLLTAGCAGTPAAKGTPVSLTGKVQCAHCDLGIRSSCQKVVTVDDLHYFLGGNKSLSFFEKFPDTETVRVTGRKRPDGSHSMVSVETIEKQ